MIILSTIMSFIATVTFGTIINVPRKALPFCGCTGALGWLTYSIFLTYFDIGVAIFFGTVLMCLLSSYFSKKLKMPAIIFNIPSLIPLVPGGSAYISVRSFLEKNQAQFFYNFRVVIIISVSMALGFMISNMIEKILINLQNKEKKS